MTTQPDTAGLQGLYWHYQAELLRFLTARTGDAAEAEDIVQDLWLKVRAAHGGPVGNGRAYLYRMAQNLVLDRLRERRRRDARERAWSDLEIGRCAPGADLPDPRANAEEAMHGQEAAARLAAAVAALPDGAGRVFRLHKLEGLSHGEVAARLGISRSGVEKHMAVAMKYLRRALRD